MTLGSPSKRPGFNLIRQEHAGDELRKDIDAHESREDRFSEYYMPVSSLSDTLHVDRNIRSHTRIGDWERLDGMSDRLIMARDQNFLLLLKTALSLAIAMTPAYTAAANSSTT
ncbi:hypothetical protein CIHG_04402 [Coccidioides immitis H538.4]|uniref:Uncharacterized protein n=1 Tax=Coccidioides immitis H538.4 TaxID=396776 RepID=A0A0J8RRM0_COCIT|nr:hypothetical protein CIHG_04402 [Coccidioides immitis H538.4]